MAELKCGFNDVPGGARGVDLLVDYGPTIFVDIGFDPDYKPSGGPQGLPPVPGLTNLEALVDTGATECCIDNQLAAHLNLPNVDKRPVSGIHGSQMANVYLAQIYVPALPFTVYGAFSGVDLIAGGLVHKVLMGRTFLSAFNMIYEGTTGTVKIISP